MAGDMSKKKLKYRPVRQNEVLDISVALSQASALLDQAAEKAIKEDNAYLLIDVAEKWIEIAKMFDTEESADEHLDTDSQSRQYGFIYEKENEVNADE
jgi:hypothetical protein